ncbi:MAG: hypothetical protein GX945_07855 [Lentisphaerae bacterium]|nr:hypothetical protein [Lentisphaerota bacterium]
MLRIFMSACISALIVRFWWYWVPTRMGIGPVNNAFENFFSNTVLIGLCSWVVRCGFLDTSRPDFAEHPGFYAEFMGYLVTGILSFFAMFSSMYQDYRHQHGIPPRSLSEKLDDLIHPPPP